ncbi:hypothetical protein ACOMHN_053822 [Nucella lapillus]
MKIVCHVTGLEYSGREWCVPGNPSVDEDRLSEVQEDGASSCVLFRPSSILVDGGLLTSALPQDVVSLTISLGSEHY